jgi:MHS family shikimate/dehydroshikimate transporter-like MFS transporter
MSDSATHADRKAPTGRQVALVSLVGTTIEWYDFQIYGLAAALVFGKLFFPSFSPVSGTLLAFATFGVGFFARPIGSIIFGHLGDRVGRRRVLMVSLVLMGLATVLIGCLPTYAQVGVWAPILLVVLRLCQGLGLGGEWGGAAVYAVESAPENQRARYGGWPQMGSPLGLLFATIMFTLVGLLPDDAAHSWGWRVPFLVSSLLVAVGIYMRRNLADTPAFTKARADNQLVKFPLATVLRRYPRELLLIFGLFSATSGGFYMFVTFIPAYGRTTLGTDERILLIGLFLFAVLEFGAVWFGTRLADRVGRRPPFIVCGLLAILLAYPLFRLVQSGSPIGIIVVLAAGGVIIGIMYGIPGSLAPEQLPPEVRYSGAGLGYQVSAAIVGGLTPVVTTAAASAAGSTWPVAALLAFFIGIGVVAALVSHETGDAKLRESEPADDGVRSQVHQAI